MKKSLCPVFILFALFSLTGCQLASENTTTSRDWLIGVYLTQEPVEQMDAEREYLEDGTCAYTFPDLDGIPFYYAPVPGESGYSWVCGFDDAIQESRAAIGDVVTDQEGTLYITTDQETYTWYLNPLYWKEDGTVYLKPAKEPITSQVMDGGGVSPKVSESFTYYLDGTSHTASTSVEVHIFGKEPVEKIVVAELDQNYGFLRKTELGNNPLPESFLINKNTRYLLTEYHYNSSVQVDYEIIVLEPGETLEEKGIPIQRVQPQGYFLPDEIALSWE